VEVLHLQGFPARPLGGEMLGKKCSTKISMGFDRKISENLL
jgi:hypothetical protein